MATIITAHLQNCCHLGKLKPCASFRTPLRPWQPSFSFLSQWVWLLQGPHTIRIILYLAFCDWFISLSIIPSRFIHIVVCDSISFLFKAEYSSRCHFILTPGMCEIFAVSSQVPFLRSHSCTSQSVPPFLLDYMFLARLQAIQQTY